MAKMGKSILKPEIRYTGEKERATRKVRGQV